MTLNTQEILDMASQLPLGLWEGKAGVCLYLAEVNKDAAQQLWQDIMQSLPQLCGNIDFSHGLTGIVFTAYQLEKKGMEVVDLDSLTKEVDALVFREMGYRHCERTHSLLTLAHLAYFEAWMIAENKDRKEEERTIRCALLKHIIDNILENVSTNEIYEPSTFSLKYVMPNILLALAAACKCNIYKMRIERTLAEMSRLFVGQLPQLHANRLFMLFALNKLYSACSLGNCWKDYISILESNLSIENVLNEVKGAIYIADGVSGIFWLLREMDVSQQLSATLRKKMLALIDNSNELKILYENRKYRQHNIGLFNGLTGVMLTEKTMKGEEL